MLPAEQQVAPAALSSDSALDGSLCYQSGSRPLISSRISTTRAALQCQCSLFIFRRWRWMISLVHPNQTHPVKCTNVRGIIFLDFAHELLIDLQVRVKATDDEMGGCIKGHQLFTSLPIIEIQYIGRCCHHKANFTVILLFPLIANSLYASDTALLPLSSPILFFPHLSSVCQPPSSSLLILFWIHQRKEKIKTTQASPTRRPCQAFPLAPNQKHKCAT